MRPNLQSLLTDSSFEDALDVATNFLISLRGSQNQLFGSNMNIFFLIEKKNRLAQYQERQYFFTDARQ